MKTVEIVVISLARATERRQRISAMFEGTAVNWRFFDAHSSLLHSGLHYNPDDARRRFGRSLSGPEIGICSSHIGALDQFVQQGSSDYVLVLEDDVIYDTNFPIDKFATLCAENGMSYVRLFAKQYAEAVILGYFYDRHIVRFKSSPTGAQAYLMSKPAARTFIDSFKRIDQPVDLAIDSFWRTKLPIYSIFPFPIIERYSRSQNLIPPFSEKHDIGERLLRFFSRASNKSKKILENFKLTSLDHKMQENNATFHQVFED